MSSDACGWTNYGEIFESGKKKLRIQKYPDMCGQGLNCFWTLFLYLLQQVCPCSGGEKQFLPMFTHAGNAHTTTGIPECLTAVYSTIETVGGNPVRHVISLTVIGEGNFV